MFNVYYLELFNFDSSSEEKLSLNAILNERTPLKRT